MRKNYTELHRIKSDFQQALSSRFSFSSSTLKEATPFTKKEARTVALSLARTRKRLKEQYKPNQLLGRRDTIGCVAVEITQRCNLDCTLCYLSDNSEDVKDIPLEEIYRRLHDVIKHYGPGVPVQITGGDPTLRKRSELVEIVKYARDLGLQPALFTNGIKASRSLIEELVSVGLMDLAFHVDITQERKGYPDEVSLNEIRTEYIERTKGLPITVIFNTTICNDNIDALPEIVDFFAKNSEHVNMASFQLQADSGRGEQLAREDALTVERVKNVINQKLDIETHWDPFIIGHEDCNNILPLISINSKTYSIPFSAEFIAEWLEDFRHITFDRRLSIKSNVGKFIKATTKKPKWIYKFLFALKFSLLLEMTINLIKSRGKIERLAFFIHNFMDANELEQDRIDGCSFMVMTHKGPVSMCEHNAHRDDYILSPIQINGTEIWEPLRERRKINRKARGERDWKYKSLNVVGSGCSGCK